MQSKVLRKSEFKVRLKLDLRLVPIIRLFVVICTVERILFGVNAKTLES